MEKDINPLVSIIIPCYNQSEYLPQTLTSVALNSLYSLECIVVDDGSTDNSTQIVEEFCKKDNRFKLVKKLNGGSASARNVGMSCAKGSYIQFLDADDILDPKKIEMQVLCMQERCAKISYVDFEFFTNQVVFHKYLKNYSVIPGKKIYEKLLTSWGIDFTIPIHSFLYELNFLSEHNLQFDQSTRLREDWGFHIKVAECNVDFLHLNWVAAYYRKGSSVKTKSWVNTSIGNIRFILNEIYRKDTMLVKVLLLYRLSEEIWQVICRMWKYKLAGSLDFIVELSHYVSMKRILYYLFGILFLPLSIFPILKRFFKYYVISKK